MERKLISIKDAAKMLGVSSLTLRNWDKNGKLPALRHPMNNYRVYKVDDIEKLIETIGSNRSPRLVKSNKKQSVKLAVRHLEE
ncbi:MerR family DNA-binding transcriptional regulator [Patescibacteria group bacterium]|nr:MerR family DNA-binding transcriptional regulator [Patescibacteria group bacterium]MDE1946826.1 MerR family DNA-binding transcriptional regulator [Patescibacteria group bacterium]MDE2011188.1 MerR family DNA-binding transcriptional regulator [Patescibacteria group bacterium]MDE2233503.1 MerR family DNA-binding transcriptional regulator [Patescibacteria group bacterium]